MFDILFLLLEVVYFLKAGTEKRGEMIYKGENEIPEEVMGNVLWK